VRGRAFVLLLASVLASGSLLVRSRDASAAAARPYPVLAYYYIWYNPSSWSRAKTDYPVLGRYSSDERRVIARHVLWAAKAGIDGFIVSWKSTPTLNRRLSRLIEIADQHRFRLVVIYEGLDFLRKPLPVAQVRDDLLFFARRYADDPAFHVFGKPLVIWSGSWEFSRQQVRVVSRAVRGRLLLLASQHSAPGYERIADLVDGDAYYWSSVNPETYPGYQRKLSDFGTAVHRHGGLWIPSAAPGFDARLIGGTSVVPRRDGVTLREEMSTAMRSSPDALGLISWNEFSENSHLEPSEKFGARYLDVVADVLGASAPQIVDFDSSASSGQATRFSYGIPLLAGIALVMLAGVLLVAWRRAHALAPGRH
jgi:hypothetical protein